MNKEIVIGSQGGGLGDNLQLTPLFKYFKKSTVEIINTDYGQDLCAIYEGLADIELKDKPILQEKFFKLYGNPSLNQPFSNGALNYLTIFGIDKYVSPIPKVFLDPVGLKTAKEFLSKYKNPIALVTYGRGYKVEVEQKYAEYRLLENSKWQIIINELSKKFTVLHFFKGDCLMKLNNCVEINNLSINQLKYFFSIIKKYIGIDTGSYHLMLAVGGFSHVIVPDLSWEHQYCPSNWQYPPELWWDEPSPRVKYYNKEREWEKVLEDL